MSAFANKDEGMGCVEGDQERKEKKKKHLRIHMNW